MDGDRRAVELAEGLSAQHVSGVAGGHQVTLVQQCQTICVETGQRQVVHRRHHGEAVLTTQAVDQFERLLLVADVQRARRLEWY